MRTWKAIAAMSENRVIGAEGRIPWHLPEDFKWFKQKTMGQILVMGRKTFESIGRPLPGRTTLVLTRGSWSYPGVRVIRDFGEIESRPTEQQIFIAGGAEIYQQALPFCSELFLTVVKREVSGEATFPPFESQFILESLLREESDFRIEFWKRANEA